MMTLPQERERAWAAAREYFGSEPYKTVLVYMETERALCAAMLATADCEIEMRRLQGSIRILDKILAGLKNPAVSNE